MRPLASWLLLVLGVAHLVGCEDPPLTCGVFVYDEVRMRCTCPEGTTERDDGSCLLPDGGVIAPPDVSDAGRLPDGGREDSGLRDGGDRGDACAEQSFYRDADEDGFGDRADVAEACVAPEGYVENDDDCNDACPSCHPGASEACDTALDEDCDGNPVTGCACTLGTLAHCSFCGDTCGWSCSGVCNDAVAVEAGNDHTCALLEDATVACWGNGFDGQLGDGTSGAGALRRVPHPVPGLVDVIQIVTGARHSCA